MNRRAAAIVALVILLALTGAIWMFSSAESNPIPTAAGAFAKALVIGFVFLELDRSKRRWALLYTALIGLVCAAAALIIGGAAV